MVLEAGNVVGVGEAIDQSDFYDDEEL